VQQVGSFLGKSGRTVDAFGKLARDPKNTSKAGLVSRQVCSELAVICSPSYAKQDPATSPGPYVGLYDDLPLDPSQLREIVSRLVIHTTPVLHERPRP
jgi:hypothetical protein